MEKQQSVKMVSEVPTEFLIELREELRQIKRGFQNINVVPQEEWLTPAELKARCKFSTFKLKELMADGVLETRRIGRKTYFHPSTPTKWFNGELTKN